MFCLLIWEGAIWVYLHVKMHGHCTLRMTVAPQFLNVSSQPCWRSLLPCVQAVPGLGSPLCLEGGGGKGDSPAVLSLPGASFSPAAGSLEEVERPYQIRICDPWAIEHQNLPRPGLCLLAPGRQSGSQRWSHSL